ncbi:MAG: YqeG family HAD IIIA-type phosphatase [Clostridia bacterium]|nr:YqeG family HAD IIIA-type phosphatase [Clostridia bacterium]
MGWLMPDYMFDHYYDITPAFLADAGIRALLIDIDNTLAPYEMPEPDEQIIRWLGQLADAGVKAALVSNNHADRITLFNQKLGLPVFPDSHKPFAKHLKIAMRQLGVTKEETAVLGDQLLTDALAGKHIGLKAIIVPPIKDKTTLFFRFKRWLEKPVIRRYKRKHQKGD